MIICLLNVLVFFSMELLTGYLKAYLLEIGGGGGQMSKRAHTQWGAITNVCVCKMGGGVNFVHFGAYILIE